MTKVVVAHASVVRLRKGKRYAYYAIYPLGDDQEKVKGLYGKEVDVIIIAEEGQEDRHEGA